MKSPMFVIASALTKFYQDADSLHGIRCSLLREHGVHPQTSNIRKWTISYARQATMALAGARPQVGQEWAICETYAIMRMRGSSSNIVWLCDIMDTQTRFLLATGISMRHDVLDFKALFDLALRRAGSKPEVVFADTAIPIEGDFKIRASTNSVQCVLEALKSRTLILRRLMNHRTPHLIASGWAVNYNFFHPLPELGGKTPAEAAGVRTTFKSWADVVVMR